MKIILDRAAINKIKNEIDNIVFNEVLDYKKNLQSEYKSNSYDTGDLVRNVKVNKQKQGVYSIEVDKIQWLVDEYGRKSWTYPNISAIKWRVQRKINTWDKSIDTVAFLIARKIYQNWIKAKHTFTKTIDKYGNQTLENIKKKIWTIS